MKDQQEKRGRGRPKGSTSFSRIRLGDLINHLGSEASVVVSNKWLAQVGINAPETPIKTLTTVDEEPKIQFTVID